MKMRNFGLISHFPIFEFVNFPSPLVFMKVGDRQIDLINVKRMNGKFFHTNLGCFELDGEYENTMNGQPFYIFNLQNSKPISLRHIEEIQNMYRGNDTKELTEALTTIYDQIEKGQEPERDENDDPIPKFSSPIDALNMIKQKMPKFLSPEILKFIIDYKYFDMADVKILNFKKIKEMKPNRDESRKIPTITPIATLFGIGMAGIVALALGGVGRLIRVVGGDPDSRGNMVVGAVEVANYLSGIFT